MKYYVVLGTKAEYIKMAPIMLEFERRRIDYTFIHTGQHNIASLVKSFETKYPNIVLTKEDGFSGNTGGAFSWAINTFKSLFKILNKDRNSFVLYHGDTMSTAIAAGVALITGNRGVHIEAGLRSGNFREPFPEEFVRNIVDFISPFCFTPSLASKARLNRKKHVFCVGNTVYDAIRCVNFNKMIKKPKKQYAICTIHRHENITSWERMKKIINILHKCPIEVRWYMHENTKKKLDDYDLLQTAKYNNVVIIPKILDYFSFLPELANSSLVITDGGSMSEEAAFFKVPVLLLRMNTEREELLNTSCQILSKLNTEEKFFSYYDILLGFDVSDFMNNPYYQNNSSKKIIDVLEEIV